MTTVPSEATPSAGGAAFSEILVAAAMAGAVMLFFGYVVLRERQGHPTLVGRLADRISEIDGLPRWVGLPMYLLIASLLTAGWGVWWDVPIHMQNGRDVGPLANPSHYPIFLGILGFTHAGVLSMGLARDPLPRRTLRLTPTWRVPMGSLVILGAGQIALLGFPADDLWHRLFGQDVTEWGPTHVMMIGGAVTCILGIPLLLAEARQVGAPGAVSRFARWRSTVALALCIIPMAFLMEFDLGVPQFPAATEFVIAGFLMGWVFPAVRMWFGRGGALFAWGVYLAVHLFLWVTIWPLDGVLQGRFLLFLPGAVLVELVALVVSPQQRPLPFGIVSGLGIGSVDLLFEWWWSGVFMPLPQPFDAGALVWLIPVGMASAVGGGILAAWHVARLRDVAMDDQAGLSESEARAGEPTPKPGGLRWAGLVGVAIPLVLMAFFAPPRAGSTEPSGEVALSGVQSADGADQCDGDQRCLARVTVHLQPTDLVEDAVWFYALAWQGRGPEGKANVPVDPEDEQPGIMRVAMEPTGVPGEFRSTHALPLYGNWKTLLRLHLAPTTMLGLPLHAPEDPAISGERGRQILVQDGDRVTFSYEKHFLQRETKDDVPIWLSTTMYALVIGSWLALVLFFGWCYGAAARGAVAVRDKDTAGPPRARQTVP